MVRASANDSETKKGREEKGTQEGFPKWDFFHTITNFLCARFRVFLSSSTIVLGVSGKHRCPEVTPWSGHSFIIAII